MPGYSEEGVLLRLRSNIEKEVEMRPFPNCTLEGKFLQAVFIIVYNQCFIIIHLLRVGLLSHFLTLVIVTVDSEKIRA
jgi:hypothetical protein